MHARRWILGLFALVTLSANTGWADDPYMHKMPDPQARRSSLRSYSVAPGGMNTGPMMMRRNSGWIRSESTEPHMLFRADRKIPGLYLVR